MRTLIDGTGMRIVLPDCAVLSVEFLRNHHLFSLKLDGGCENQIISGSSGRPWEVTGTGILHFLISTDTELFVIDFRCTGGFLDHLFRDSTVLHVFLFKTPG